MTADASFVNRPALTDAEKLHRLHDLESEAYEMANMAGIVWDLLSDLFEGSINGEKPELVGGVEHCHIIDPGRLERLHFAASHSWDLTTQFKDRFLEGLVGR